MIHQTRRNAINFAEGLNEILAKRNVAPLAKGLLQSRSKEEALQALFLGIKGGNAKYLEALIKEAIAGHVEFREKYKSDDPDYVDDEVQATSEFKDTMDLIYAEYRILLTDLQKSGTFYSMRSIGHMLWDVNIPGVLGYFAALLYNQNNVAAEASPVTTLMEMVVGDDLCKMLGYTVQKYGLRNPAATSDTITAWGHITCDGSVANLEALWMARNMKFYPVSVKLAMGDPENRLYRVRDQFKIRAITGKEELLFNMSPWSLMNLRIDDVLAIPQRMDDEFQIDPTDFGNDISAYNVQSMGYYQMVKYCMGGGSHSPVSMGPATMHYSWPKGAAILGIGADNMLAVKVDNYARMEMRDLRNKLEHCLRNKIPVMNVVAVFGTTEESAVDHLKEILEMRIEFNAKGLEFAVHADAAWGGYFASMIMKEDKRNPFSFSQISDSEKYTLPMSKYVTEQYELLGRTDSITIDPHKAGYVPYPAGGLCYRNSAMRNLVAFTAPVVYHGGVDPTVGVYGVEGSKPGAAAAAVKFSHTIIRPDQSGYGKIIGHCMFNVKRLYAAFVIWNLKAEVEKNGFFIVPLVPIPAEQEGKSEVEIQAQYQFIKDRIVNVSDERLMQDDEAFALFKELGQDQTIITYMFNFVTEGVVNEHLSLANTLNDNIYKAFSYSPNQIDINTTDLVVTASQFSMKPYGPEFMNYLRGRLGVKGEEGTAINFNISTIMNPFLTNTNRGSFIPEIIDIFTKRIILILAQD